MTTKEMIATIAMSFLITFFAYLNTLLLRYRIKHLMIENGHLWDACDNRSNFVKYDNYLAKAEKCREERKISLMMGAMS